MTKSFAALSARVRAILFVFAGMALGGGAMAQENALGPAPPLEFPFEATPDSPRAVNMEIFRFLVERGADFGLCKALMIKDGEPMPRDAQGAEVCPQNYAQMVKANEGFIQWAPNARPLKCDGCVGRPFMSPEDNLTAPNLRRAKAFGRLQFLSTTGPNRTITYGFDAYFTCKTQNGAKEGDLSIDIKFNPPVIGEPGFWESFASFFSAGALSDFIDGKIKENVRALPNIGMAQGRCRSIGVERADSPKFDAVRYDLPQEAAGSGPGRVAATALARVGETATVRLLSVKRLPLPLFIAPEHGRPGDPVTGQFTLFTNGQTSFLPPDGLALPPEGGVAPLNFCKTVDMSGRQTLQVLFKNDLGGAVWSQFDRGASFGAGSTRIMTTGRTIVVPGLPGPPDPLTGKPAPGAKPQPVVLREFELTYDVTFNAAPVLSAETAPAKPKKSRLNPALKGAAKVPRDLEIAADPAAPAPSPCRNL